MTYICITFKQAFYRDTLKYIYIHTRARGCDDSPERDRGRSLWWMYLKSARGSFCGDGKWPPKKEHKKLFRVCLII
jgi:hypothetical protein